MYHAGRFCRSLCRTAHGKLPDRSRHAKLHERGRCLLERGFVTDRCCREFTGQRSQAKRNWMTTLQSWRKQRRETTARSARKWICSRCTEEAPGFPFFMPKGMIIRNELETFWRDRAQKERLRGDQDTIDS